MAKKQRKMTEAEADEYLANMQQGIRKHLDGIQTLLPPGYAITFVARHVAIEDAQLILSKDPDIEAVANALLKAKTDEAGDDKQPAA